jgi:cytochrome c biogenesis protein
MTDQTNIGSESQVSSVFKEIGAFFTSVKTTVVVLFALAMGSIIGTIVPQTSDIASIQVKTNFALKLILILDLNNVFRSWWFILLLVLLSTNILGCLIRRLRVIPGEWSGANEKSSFRISLKSNTEKSELLSSLNKTGSKIMGNQAELVEGGNKTTLKWTKQKIYLLGFPLLHSAILIILFGGLLGAIYGFRGHIVIPEGESGKTFRLGDGSSSQLPFEIVVDTFSLIRYPTGEPKEFRSTVRLQEGGKDVLDGSILVNHPLTYKRISLYQSDYQTLGIKDVRIGLEGPDGKKSEIFLPPRKSINLPGTNYEIRLMSLDPGSTIKGAGIEVKATAPEKDPISLSIFRKEPPQSLDGHKLSFIDYRPLYATGLQVSYDPGSFFVWLGCSMMVMGFFLSLFTNFRRLTVTIVRDPGSGESTIDVSGRSRRMRKEFREKIEQEFRSALPKA